MVYVVDLFYGVGGLTHGFVKEGFKVVAGIDADPTCEYAFETNNAAAKFMLRDVNEIKRPRLLLKRLNA